PLHRFAVSGESVNPSHTLRIDYSISLLMNRLTNLFQNRAILWIGVFSVLVLYWVMVNLAM
ncbi:hypothetical protein, partial [Fischerella thermalis]|uniref:hypothetical protein n=1 Tax=Fischerella thermalis TaxID=372787 RepID=UPI001CA52342